MNEYQRMQYLDAMGVDSFVPRLLLPNAKASMQCVVSPAVSAPNNAHSLGHHANGEPVDEGVTERADSSFTPSTLRSINEGLSGVLDVLNLDTADSAHGNQRAATLEKSTSTHTHSHSHTHTPTHDATDTDTLRSDSRFGTSGHERPDTSEGDHSRLSTSSSELVSEPKRQTVDQIHTEASELAQFNLALWFTDTALQIIDSREENDALPTETLLSNILFAHGLLQTRLSKVELQRWPIPGIKLSDKSWQAASAMLFDFFSYRFETQKPRAFILFGQSALRAVSGDACSLEDVLFQTIDLDAYQTKAIVLPSLRDLLYEPELKRKLWYALQPLMSG